MISPQKTIRLKPLFYLLRGILQVDDLHASRPGQPKPASAYMHDDGEPFPVFLHAERSIIRVPLPQKFWLRAAVFLHEAHKGLRLPRLEQYVSK